MTPDCELLRKYAETSAEDCFAELVRRHLDLVYSTALRQVNGDAHLAQDVAQTVFTDLARKAAPLSRRATLSGWLYTSAHYAALKAVRTEGRRRAREQEAQTMRDILHEPAPNIDWGRLQPILDEAMLRLKEADREAVLLRYFENRRLEEIGARLGLSQNAARMRIDRALEKLHTFLVRRGVTTTTAALSLAISTHAVHAAPPGLAALLTAPSLAGGATGTGAGLAALKLMAMTKFKLGVISAVAVAGAVTPLVIQHQTQVRLRAENLTLRAQLSQMAALTADYERLTNSLALAASARESMAEDVNSLSRLQSELMAMRSGTNQLASLREENRRLRTLMSEKPPLRTREAAQIAPGQTDFPKESWAFAGYASPEATLQTALVALRGRDLKFYLKTLTPDARKKIDPILEQDDAADEFTARESKALKEWSGYRVVNREVLAEDQVLLHIEVPEIGEQVARMQRFEENWRFAGFDAKPSP